MFKRKRTIKLLLFLVLAALLYRFLFQPVMSSVKAREAEREQMAEQIAQDQEDAERLRAELEARLASAEEEAAAIITRAQEQAKTERTAMLHETQTEVERILTGCGNRPWTITTTICWTPSWN